MSTPELWNLDISLADYLASRLREFAASSNGHPDTMSAKDWQDKILGIAVRLERYAQRLELSFEMENEVVKAGQAALKELADIFPALWD
jgi:hypothetical protein